VRAVGAGKPGVAVSEYNQENRVDSEIGALRTVLLHRPGGELVRLTPRNNSGLLFEGIPWLARAQQEHDAFAQVLRVSGVEVLYVERLLEEVLVSAATRSDAIAAVTSQRKLGARLAQWLGKYLTDLNPAEVASRLIAGLAPAELPIGPGLVHRLMDVDDFLIDPLPNLMFTRDSSFWVGQGVGVSSFAMTARTREADLLKLIYRHHARFVNVPQLYEPELEPLEGGDVLLLAPKVVAIGIGERSTAAGAERLAGRLLATETCHTVLAVPIPQRRASMHLDTLITMVNHNTVVANADIMKQLSAYPLRLTSGNPDSTVVVDRQIDVGEPIPLLQATAAALAIDELHLIGTGLDPVTAEREQWDDGNNTLCLKPGVVVAYERNAHTNSRLEQAGIEVLRISGSELGSGRGGPRCMSCPIWRDRSHSA